MSHLYCTHHRGGGQLTDMFFKFTFLSQQKDLFDGCDDRNMMHDVVLRPLKKKKKTYKNHHHPTFSPFNVFLLLTANITVKKNWFSFSFSPYSCYVLHSPSPPGGGKGKLHMIDNALPALGF